MGEIVLCFKTKKGLVPFYQLQGKIIKDYLTENNLTGGSLSDYVSETFNFGTILANIDTMSASEDALKVSEPNNDIKRGLVNDIRGGSINDIVESEKEMLQSNKEELKFNKEEFQSKEIPFNNFDSDLGFKAYLKGQANIKDY